MTCEKQCKKVTIGKLSGPVNAIILPFRLRHLRKPLSCQAESRVVNVASKLYRLYDVNDTWAIVFRGIETYLGHSKACVITKS